MANIQERRNGKGEVRFRVQVRVKGYPAQTATFPTKTAAKLWAKTTEAAIAEGRHFKTAEAKKHTLGDVVDKYLREALPGKRYGQERKGHLAWWKEKLGAYSLNEVTPARIAEARDTLLGEPTKQGPRKPATVVRYLAALSHALSMAVKEWGWLEANPMQKVRRPPEPRGRVRFLSDDERARLLEACRASRNPALYPVVVLALATGMRRGEILGLKWAAGADARDMEDGEFRGYLDVAQGRVTLHATKNGERRVVPLVGHAREVLRDWGKVRRLNSGWVFPGKSAPPRTPGTRVQNSQDAQDPRPVDVRAAFVRAVARAKLADFHFHDTRHTAASYLAMDGASLAEIAEVLGHKTLSMVRRYAHLSESHTAGVVERMNRRIFGGAE
jgi:integrase